MKVFFLGALVALVGCTPRQGGTTQAPRMEDSAAAGAPTSGRDSTALVPPGFGSLRQEDIALRMQLQGLQVRAIPLDESIIRLLAPDSYRTLHELVVSQKPSLAAIELRTGLRGLSLWYVSFFGAEVGDARFSPMEVVLASVGRDFRPLEVMPLTPGFGTQRLRQREVQSAIFAFDPQVDVNQPLVLQYETVRTAEWSAILSRIERERALVRSRIRG